MFVALDNLQLKMQVSSDKERKFRTTYLRFYSRADVIKDGRGRQLERANRLLEASWDSLGPPGPFGGHLGPPGVSSALLGRPKPSWGLLGLPGPPQETVPLENAKL